MKINLGCGNLPLENYINHDIRKHRPEIELAFDLNYHDWRTAGRLLEFMLDNKMEFFDEVRAWDVLEHLDSPLNFMNNCWNILGINGVLDMKVCGWQNPNAHVDITHKRPGFDIKSFDYFDPDTAIGIEYGYYTDKKWKILSKNYDRKNNVLIKLTPIK